MTVKELIRLLNKMEPDEDVFFEDDQRNLHLVSGGLMERLIDDKHLGLFSPKTEEELYNLNEQQTTKEVVVLR